MRNLERSDGLVSIVGYTNESQVLDTYSKGALSTLKTGLMVNFVFNPKNKKNPDTLGEKPNTDTAENVPYS